jgi:2-dehydro-3-deoxyphosphogluconate aldolase/(4S)-4-hydroxy-2-oxoglutarate aldolase
LEGKYVTQNIAAIDAILTLAPVAPVLVLDDPELALSLGRALVAGGLPALEVTLRTPRALECIAALKSVAGAIVGAGTVLDRGQLEAAVAAGAAFLVSPGSAPRLLEAAENTPVPLLPGIATASEAMALLERGYRRMKFFPAEVVGGVAHLKSLAAPLPRIRFCPTGGISLEKAPKYLALPNVICVGGSWIAPAGAIQDRDWGLVERLAREAAQLTRPE